METKNPELFKTYQTREEVPSSERIYLVTPFDPTLPIKHWRDPNPPTPDDEGLVEYYALKKVNGAFVWNATENRPAFTRMFVDDEMAQLFNIPPKDFTGKTQDIILPALETPVQRVPPAGWIWTQTFMGPPMFGTQGTEKVTLESLNEKLDAILNKLG